MILFTQSTPVLHKYLNDELRILCLLQFFPQVAQNSQNSLSFPCSKKSLSISGLWPPWRERPVNQTDYSKKNSACVTHTHRVLMHEISLKISVTQRRPLWQTSYLQSEKNRARVKMHHKHHVSLSIRQVYYSDKHFLPRRGPFSQDQDRFFGLEAP